METNATTTVIAGGARGADTLAVDWANSRGWNSTVAWLSNLGRWLFAGSAVIFGVQHFMYAGFIATSGDAVDSGAFVLGVCDGCWE